MSKSTTHLIVALAVGAVAVHVYHTKMKPGAKG